MTATRSRLARLTATFGTIAVLLGASACATDAPQENAAPSTTSSAPAPTTSEPAPTTSSAPKTSEKKSETKKSEAPKETVTYIGGPESIGPGEEAYLSFTVETPHEGVPNGKLTLIVDGSEYATEALDDGGNLTFAVTDLGPGEHTYQGKFQGNKAYSASDSNTVSFTVLTAEEVAAAEKKAAEEQAAKEAAEKEAAESAANNPCPPTADACVDLTNNTTWLQENGKITAGPYAQIAGREGHRTPPGSFTVFWKNIDHKSTLFDDAPMPYAIFFNGDIAFHVGALDVPSHGCIHLSESAAVTYWDALQEGDTVYVFGEAQTY
ncbi:L,D-transpeptidase family protein [Cumulibacter soli]|uniref:L,D-transpeptidase family protein n=1 Tax=Cumulibacter soli TaxID=2546344 RepID=UPI0010676AF7|nr:Ig-like domain repeat protein [Cumulibacter soli]